MCDRFRRIGAEHLEVDDRPQPELGCSHHRGAAVAAVADGRDAAREELGRAEPRDVDVLLPAQAPFALRVKPNPLGEIGQRVAEACIDGVLEVGVRVDEARQDRCVRVVRSIPELVGGAHRRDPAVFDRDRAALDRCAFDRQHPVCGQDHSVSTLASTRGERRSTSTASQIDPS